MVSVKRQLFAIKRIQNMNQEYKYRYGLESSCLRDSKITNDFDPIMRDLLIRERKRRKEKRKNNHTRTV